ncbi:MAG: nucleotidyltransferase domain-containing protein [Methylococcaceae bacterium]|nr:nucleotidyltransferase domain-containing protein [Methylococcaceae bacterium]
MGNRYGLKESTISAIQDVLKQHHEVQQALLYGSRAKGNYRNGSDIDLTLLGDGLTYATLNRIETEIDDLLLPYSFDLSLYAQIDNADLLDHIARVGQAFYQRDTI